MSENKEADNFWCNCGNPSDDVTHHEDEDGQWWTCDDCGKTLQVG
jgi:hypothetical protein